MRRGGGGSDAVLENALPKMAAQGPNTCARVLVGGALGLLEQPLTTPVSPVFDRCNPTPQIDQGLDQQ